MFTVTICKCPNSWTLAVPIRSPAAVMPPQIARRAERGKITYANPGNRLSWRCAIGCDAGAPSRKWKVHRLRNNAGVHRARLIRRACASLVRNVHLLWVTYWFQNKASFKIFAETFKWIHEWSWNNIFVKYLIGNTVIVNWKCKNEIVWGITKIVMIYIYVKPFLLIRYFYC